MKAAIREPAPPRSFRDFLLEQLAARCRRNPQYSLRAFANHLGVHHATLSQMLRGKRTITADAIGKFGFRLGLSREQIDDWAGHSRPVLPIAGERVRELTRDTAEVVADWRNFAILELTRLSDFQPDSRWIGRMLGITADEVNVCISRLCRLGLLRMDSPSEWRDQLGDAILDAGEFHRAVIANLAVQAGGSSAAGGMSSVMMAVPSKSVPAAIERIARFREELVAWLASASDKDAVFQLEIRFVPVTRRE